MLTFVAVISTLYLPAYQYSLNDVLLSNYSGFLPGTWACDASVWKKEELRDVSCEG